MLTTNETYISLEQNMFSIFSRGKKIMIIYEYFKERRDQVAPLHQIISDFQDGKISKRDFSKALKIFIQRFFRLDLDVQIVSSKYPEIFVWVDIDRDLNLHVISLTYSDLFFEKFDTGQIVAATLHQIGWAKLLIEKKNLRNLVFFYEARGYIAKAISLVYLASTGSIKIPKLMRRVVSSLLISSVIMVILTFYFRKKMFEVEVVQDSLATEFGYGTELISFIERYKDPGYLMGYPEIKNSAGRLLDTINSILSRIFSLTNEKRICYICLKIISMSDKSDVDYEVYEKAKEIFQRYCKGKKINPKEIKEIQDKLQVFLEDNLSHTDL